MRNTLAVLLTITILAIVSSCSNETSVIAEPFGISDFSKILNKSGVQLCSEDYIIQVFSEKANIYDKSTFVKSLDATFISIECFDENGRTVQHGFAYYFENAENASEYFDFVSTGIYEAMQINENTVWFEKNTEDRYKSDIITAYNEGLFDPQITYISKPFISEQAELSVPEHSVEKCKD